MGDEWEPITQTWGTLQLTTNVSMASANELQGISCPENVGECVATGESVTSGVASGLGEELKGDSWEQLTMAVPSGAKSSSLSRVWCLEPRYCSTVGNYVNSSGETVMLVESTYL